MVDPRDEPFPEEPERAERPERADTRPDRPERADRADRPDRSDRTADRGGGGTAGGADRFDRAGTDRGEREDGLRQRLEALVPEIVKKTFSAGMGAVFSTEEGIRRIAREVNIPDVAGYVASAADTTKDRVLEIVARETREFLQTMNFAEEVAKLLTMLSFEVKTEIRFIPNAERYGGVEPDVKASARIKRSERPDTKDKADRADKGDKGDKDGGDGEKKRRFWRREDEPGDDDGGGDR